MYCLSLVNEMKKKSVRVPVTDKVINLKEFGKFVVTIPAKA